MLTGERKRWTVWLGRGAFAVTDQGLMSGSNFVLSILLARWLSPEQYGAYALAFSMFFFVSAVHQALVLEPMSVLGTAEYSTRPREYGGAMLWFQAAFSILLAVVFGAAALLARAMGQMNFSAALLGLALGAPGILLFWLARMTCYVNCSPATAACGAAVYSAALFSGAGLLWYTHRLSVVTVFVLMGAAACLTAAVLLLRFRPDPRCGRVLLREAAKSHWRYGRWALGSSLVIWVPGNIFYSITSAILGLGSAGAFRALMNLSYPVTHTCNALSLLVQPQLSGAAARSGGRSTLRGVAAIGGLYAAGALFWLAVIALGSGRLWRLLYGNHFHSSSGLAVWILVGVVFQVAAYAPAVGLRALQAPALVFGAYSIAAVACLAVGIPATQRWGLPGAVASWAGALLLSFLATLALYLRRARSPREGHAPDMEPMLSMEAG